MPYGAPPNPELRPEPIDAGAVADAADAASAASTPDAASPATSATSTASAADAGKVKPPPIATKQPPPNIHKPYGAPPADAKLETHTLGNLEETIVRRESVPLLRVEPEASPTTVLSQQIRFSEFADWASVARWGTALFAQPGTGAALDELASRIRTQAGDDKLAQLRAALDFVQKEVRYFGTEIGTGSHRPASPDTVLAQRFGDCKDKVTLLIALLRRLDIEAAPVLVNSALRGRVDQLAPTPLAFDHVIARVQLAGATYWLDATRGNQSGPVARRQSTDFAKGLLLLPGTDALVAMPTPFDVEQVKVVDTLRFDAMNVDPVLVSRITYRGDLAESFREVIAKRGTQDLGNAFMQPYLSAFPKLKPSEALKVEQAEDDDALTIVQAFVVPHYWRFPDERLLVADMLHWPLIDALGRPNTPQRRDAFRFPLPGVYRHVFVTDFPEDIFAQPPSQTFDDGDDHVALHVVVQGTRRRVENEAELRITADEVAAADWPEYTARLQKLIPRLAGTVSISAVPNDKLEALQSRMKKIEERVRSKDLPARTDTQRRAWLRLELLQAQIEGGRLPPALMSQALVARGSERDHVGQFTLARADFDKAASLAPEAVEPLVGAAVNAFSMQDYPRTIDFAERALKLDGRNAPALNHRALARYFQKDLAGARADLEQELKNASEVRRGYPVVWLALALRQSGVSDPAALKAAYAEEQLPREWPRPLVDLMLGRSDVDAVVKAAKATKNADEALCEAYFYIGEKYHVEGDESRATGYWRKAADLGITEYIEDGAARARLGIAAASR